MIYLDNAATTRVFDKAVDAACEAMRTGFFNPNATYKSGVDSREVIEKARMTIAHAIGTSPDEIIFTSGATESNNWVFSCGRKNPKGNIVVTSGEHASVYECAMQLKNRGLDVRFAPLTKDGIVDCEKLLDLVDQNTALVSLIHVSNETGAVNPVKQISAAVKKIAPRALIHCDGVQALLKTDPINSLNVDFYSASAHKVGAPKGIGLLYIRKGLNIAPYFLGGGQERNLRSGTQNTPYISAFAAAVEQFSSLCNHDKTSKIRDAMRDYFIKNGCTVIGDKHNSGYILCVCVPGVKAEILQNLAHDRGVIIGKGAACSGSKRGNRVLSAIGLGAKQIECCIRISLFVDTSEQEAMEASKVITECAEIIRSNHVG